MYPHGGSSSKRKRSNVEYICGYVVTPYLSGDRGKLFIPHDGMVTYNNWILRNTNTEEDDRVNVAYITFILNKNIYTKLVNRVLISSYSLQWLNVNISVKTYNGKNLKTNFT